MPDKQRDNCDISANMLLACDEMLQKLARWLRAAGYDTWLASSGMSDSEIVKIVKQENRLLLTRDRELANYKNAEKNILVLYKNCLEDCIKEINIILDINWICAPFSRCTLCNTLLEHRESFSLEGLPEDIRRDNPVIQYCPTCNKLYWYGSHARHMLEKLESFNRLVQ